MDAGGRVQFLALVGVALHDEVGGRQRVGGLAKRFRGGGSGGGVFVTAVVDVVVLLEGLGRVPHVDVVVVGIEGSRIVLPVAEAAPVVVVVIVVAAAAGVGAVVHRPRGVSVDGVVGGRVVVLLLVVLPQLDDDAEDGDANGDDDGEDDGRGDAGLLAVVLLLG